VGLALIVKVLLRPLKLPVKQAKVKVFGLFPDYLLLAFSSALAFTICFSFYRLL